MPIQKKLSEQFHSVDLCSEYRTMYILVYYFNRCFCFIDAFAISTAIFNSRSFFLVVLISL